MKFTIAPEHGIKQVSVTLWDADNDKELCTFTDGEFDTEDQAVIDKLVDLGYEYEGMPDVVPDPDQTEGDQAIRDKARELGIKSWHLKSIETLKEEIAGKE